MLAERPELANHEFQSPHYKRLVDLAERLAGFPYILGTHLGGFILSRDPITDRVPLQWAAKGVIVAQFDKDDIETLGLVKMDILGLRMHSAIAEAVRLHRRRAPASTSRPGSCRATTRRSTSSSARRARSACSSSKARASATSPRACASATSKT